MAGQPLVSVIVPNYNYGQALGQCLRAIQAQTYSPIEIVLVDDGSTDDSVDVAESLGVTPIRTPVNRGCGAARNLGAANATGDILFFLDSDIALDPSAVAAAVQLLESDPNIGAVCGTYEPEPLNPGGLAKEYRNLYHHYYWRAAEGPTNILVPGLTVMTRKVWDDVGPFSEHLMQTEAAVVAGRLIDRYSIRMTTAVHGRHDDDPNMWVALRKVFTRTRMQVPFFLQRRYAAGVIASAESRASAFAALSVVTLPLPLITGVPALAAVPILLLGTCFGIDRRMYQYVFGLRGAGFGMFFAAAHFLVNLTIAAGAALGIAQWAASPSFRRLYE